MSNCKHNTAIVSCSIESLGLTQMICTWQCQKPFWMLQTGLTTKEVPNEEAAKMIAGISDNTNENAGRVRIEPQPELVHPTSEWWIIGDDVDTLHMEDGMIDYLGNNVAGDYAGNSTVFENCTPVLVDGVWYWQEEKGDE